MTRTSVWDNLLLFPGMTISRRKKQQLLKNDGENCTNHVLSWVPRLMSPPSLPFLLNLISCCRLLGGIWIVEFDVVTDSLYFSVWFSLQLKKIPNSLINFLSKSLLYYFDLQCIYLNLGSTYFVIPPPPISLVLLFTPARLAGCGLLPYRKRVVQYFPVRRKTVVDENDQSHIISAKLTTDISV